ncbi:MAG: type IV toxin-antitoxin system AbiEi family antitoxin domain-containing protein [Elusimicrobia bacterium]|nr:type IV toxin-antitoxin system AbiEi family antitoxin domain-containing protein [Elusimicrobiota bacterium]
MTAHSLASKLAVFHAHGGMLRTSEALRRGIHPRDLYAMRDSGLIEKLTRGLYRVSSLKPLGNPDLVTVALKVPKGVICLISALAFHEITTQSPHEVYVALLRSARSPRLDHPPTRFAWFNEPAFKAGIETHRIDGVGVRVYCPEKTVADCFKARNRIGLDVAIEALKLCRRKKRSKAETFLKYAKACRVEKVMRPYLEALL